MVACLSVKYHCLVSYYTLHPVTVVHTETSLPGAADRGRRAAALREWPGSSRQRNAEVIVGPARGDAAAAGTLDEAALQQVGLVDVLHSVARLT